MSETTVREPVGVSFSQCMILEDEMCLIHKVMLQVVSQF